MDLIRASRRMDTRDLHLRPLELTDAAGMFALLSDPLTVKYWSNAPITDIDKVQDMLTRDVESDAGGNSISWAITQRSVGEMIGKCVLFQVSEANHRAEIGYILNRAYWRRGWMYQALQAVIRCGFEELGLHRIEADVDPHNVGSLALMEKLGFQREGYFRERWLISGQWQDSVMLGLLNPDKAG